MSPVLPREERAAEVLMRHRFANRVHSAYGCACGAPVSTPGALAAHQATMLATAGLLADPDALDAAEEENERLRTVQQAITECRDDPAGAIVRADRIAGEHILRAIAAEAERDAARAEVAALRAAVADAEAAQWTALADEMETFAAGQAPEQGEVLL